MPPLARLRRPGADDSSVRFVQRGGTVRMSRLLAVLLACLFAVAPSADALCKAACSPAPATAPSCHEIVAPSPDGALTPTNSCRRDVDLAVPPTDTRRVVPSPVLVALPATTPPLTTPAQLRTSAFVRPPRGKPAQAFPSSIVLRI